MSTIRVIYHGEPHCAPENQHPDAARYQVKSSVLGKVVFVDALGGEPTSDEVDAVLNPPQPTKAEKIESMLAKQGLTMEDLNAELVKWYESTQ